MSYRAEPVFGRPTPEDPRWIVKDAEGTTILITVGGDDEPNAKKAAEALNAMSTEVPDGYRSFRVSVPQGAHDDIVQLQQLAECDLPTLIRRAFSIYRHMLRELSSGSKILVQKEGGKLVELDIP